MADGTLKVGTITTSSGSGTITLGQSGESVTVPSGCTITNNGTITNSGTATGFTTQMFDQYGLNSSLTLSAGVNTTLTDWTRASNLTNYGSNYYLKGSAMSVSSGIFTFPSTGNYQIRLMTGLSAATTGADRQIHPRIHFTTDNSSYDDFAYGSAQVATVTGSTDFSSAYVQAAVSITDTANQKIKIICYADTSNAKIVGDSRYLNTNICFWKLN